MMRTDALADPFGFVVALLLTVLSVYAVLWRVGVVEVRGAPGPRRKRIGLGGCGSGWPRFDPSLTRRSAPATVTAAVAAAVARAQPSESRGG